MLCLCIWQNSTYKNLSSTMSSLACEHKIAFTGYQEAQGAAVVAQWNYGANVTPYLCTFCGAWHLATVYED